MTWYADTQSVVVDDIPSDPVGIVNGEPVSTRYFSYFLKPRITWEEQRIEDGTLSDEDLKRIKMEMFESVAERVMLNQKVKEYDIHLSTKDKDIINANVSAGVQNSGGMANYRMLLEKNQIYFSETISIYQERYLINKLVNMLVMDVHASEDQLLEYYLENKENYEMPEQRRAKHILVPFEDGSDESKSEVKKFAQEVLDRLNAGEDFDTLMHEFSKDPGLVNFPDGYTFPRGQMVAEFEEAAFSMRSGEVSGLVETAYGYHILKVEEEIPAQQLPFEEVVEEIKAALEPMVKETYWQDTLVQWNEETVIEFQP